MTEVTVDGVKFVPATSTGPRIGIGITTRNRPEILAETYKRIFELTPGAKIVVVDDASDSDFVVGPDTFHFTENVGIARAKNKCLEMLYEADCEHIFLFDDDAYPLIEKWWAPYVNSPEPHLMRIFEDLAGPNKLNDITKIYDDSWHVAWTGPRGIMLYVERWVLDVVGGMDLAYGKWGYEHGDWSGRIHNAGLTTHRFADVTNGGELIYSMDEHEEVDRSVHRRERQALVRKNVEIYRANWHSKEYHEFREPLDIVLTCLYVGKPDPQRPGTRPPAFEKLDPLVKSLGEIESIVFSDSSTALMSNTTRVNSARLGVDNLYIQRWIDYWHWLRDHPEVRFVWCVDGTDVEMLRNPFPEMEHGVLYLGTENTVVSSGWLEKNPHPDLNRLVTSHPGLQMLNAGLVGGDRKTVMEFIHAMTKLYFDNRIDVILVRAKDLTEVVNDMGILNLVGRSEAWEGRIVTGPMVNTTFKANERNNWSWWKHK